MPRKETAAAPITAESQQSAVSEGIDAFELPKALVTKIAKSALPETAQLRKETVLALLKGSTVFINLLGAAAHDVATSKQHKSVSASDVLRALELIQFTDVIDLLQADLQMYRELQKSSRKSAAAGGVSAKGKVADIGATAQALEPMSLSQVIPTSKSKGKERVAGVLPLSDPGIQAQPQLERMDVYMDSDMIVGEQPDNDVVEEIDPSEDVPEDDEEDDLADQVAFAEDELNKDVGGLDHHVPEPEE